MTGKDTGLLKQENEDMKVEGGLGCLAGEESGMNNIRIH